MGLGRVRVRTRSLKQAQGGYNPTFYDAQAFVNIGLGKKDDLQRTTLGLLGDVPLDRLLVTESGILGPQDVARMRAADVHAFLVGEAFMRAADPGVALAALFR